MARYSFSFMGLCALGLGSLAGCQPQPQTVAQVPQPSFSAPRIDAHAAPAQRSYAGSPAPLPHATIPKSTPGIIAAAGPRDWVPVVHPKPWVWIILHHSATPSGGARKFDADHRARGFDDLGYDFVIGNGTESGNGQIEVGPRWRAQRVGAHTQDPSGMNRFNERGIGVCFVGNFDVTRPTQEQIRSSAKLVAYLMKTYHIPADHVLGHRDCKPTDCPGRYFPLAQVRRMATQQLAAAGEIVPPDTYATSGELLHDVAPQAIEDDPAGE